MNSTAIIDSKVVFLYDSPDDSLESGLTVYNANGDEVRRIEWIDYDRPIWCHEYGQFVICWGDPTGLITPTVLIYHEEDLIREETDGLESRQLEFPEKTRNDEDESDDEYYVGDYGYVNAATVINRTSIKRYRINQNSLETEVLKFCE